MTTLAVFWQVKSHDFVNYDDQDYVTQNPHVRAGWTIEGVIWAFKSQFHRHWQMSVLGFFSGISFRSAALSSSSTTPLILLIHSPT